MSLVMERPRAAAVIGDLLEAGVSRGEGWFWSNVVRAWIASVWSDAKSEPRFVLGIAVLGILVCWGVSIAAELVFLFTTELVRSLVSPPLSIHGEVSLAFLQMLTAVFAGSFYAGQWIARFSLGREIAVCFAMVIVGPIVFAALGALFWLLLTLMHGLVGVAPPTFTLWNSAWIICPLVPYLLGAAQVRRQRQNTGAI